MLDKKRLFSPHSIPDLVEGWLIHAHKSRDRHDLASRTYAKGQYALGIPALIASTVVGTSLFASLSTRQVPPLWVGLLSLAAALLGAIQTFMDFGGRSDKHRLTAVRYKAVIRALEYLNVTRANGEPLSDEKIAALQSQLDTLEEAAPVVMPNIYDRVEANYRKVVFVKKALELYNGDVHRDREPSSGRDT